jgi:hypothetical protein
MKLFQFWQWIKNCADANMTVNILATVLQGLQQMFGRLRKIWGVGRWWRVLLSPLEGTCEVPLRVTFAGFWVIDVDQNY